jgi:CDGSH-type Zn-finger protein
MAASDGSNTDDEMRVVVEFDGPYRIEGNVPLVRKTQVVSEHGEPLTWKKEETLEAEPPYFLCRCGHSKEFPICDSTHFDVGFDGTENAETNTTAERQVTLPGGTKILIKRDHSLCMESGFCGNRLTNIDGMVAGTSDSQVRAQVMAMVERCPSGSFVYSTGEGEQEIEPDLPRQIAATIEITSDGPIHGPLWVTGNIPIERSDGEPFETRNRVTLCNCGESKKKPLCDGTHRELASRKI